MSERRQPTEAALVVSVIYRLEDRFDGAIPRMVSVWGEPERISGPFLFDKTGYYRREMGEPLIRRFFVGRRPVARDTLPDIKVAAEAIEREFVAGGRRTVNIDPGLLTEENFILATGKNFSHRVYLGNGVYADLTLMYREGEYRALPWTYPDYATDEIRTFLGMVRESFRQARKGRTEDDRNRGDDVA